MIPDIAAILRQARHGRGGMVQTADQYQFIFEAALAHLRAHSWTPPDEPTTELSRV